MTSELPSVSEFDEVQSEQLHVAVSQLPSEFRDALVLHLDDELTFAEIGNRLGRSEHAARKLFTHALDRLRGRLSHESDASQ